MKRNFCLTAVLSTTLLLGVASSTLADDSTVSTTVSTTVKVGAISFEPEKLKLEQNAQILEESFRRAAAGGAKIALAPEGSLDGFVINEIIAGKITQKQLREVSLTIDSPMIQRFRDLAKELELCLAFGFVERVGEELFNCAIFIDHRGEIAGKYHKMQLAEGYHPSWWWNRLGKESRAFDTPYGRAGFLICNDRWNDQLARIPVLDGARFLLIPAFGSRSKAQDDAVCSRARENGVPIIEANVGVLLIVDGEGRVIEEDRRDLAIAFAEITIPPAVTPDHERRDRVEAKFLEWRKREMSKRYRTSKEKSRAWRASYESFAEGPLRVRPLPGHEGFTFTMYGCPGSYEHFRELVETMRREHLGNGFDPGPGVHPNYRKHFEHLREIGWPVVAYANTADHQVKEGTCRITDEQQELLEILSDSGQFTATQIGEWGYYFHNLSHRESWWRAVYGQDFEKQKRWMKPEGLAGYDHMPKSRAECYEIVEDYFRTRQARMRGWNLSITGHSHYEAYAGQWGARVVGLELGENIAFSQSKMAFARGAARRNGKPWSVQVSQWFHGSTTSSGPLEIKENGTARGLDAGHSLSFYERMWLHSWFAGAAMVTPEASISIFFESERPPYRLTSHGRKVAEIFRFLKSREDSRGVPFIPLAIVLDQCAGYNGYMGKPWGILEPKRGDVEVRDLLEEQLFPDSDHIHHKPFPENPEASYLRPTPFGEIVDVQLSDAPEEILGAYPVILIAGEHRFPYDFVSKLVRVTGLGTRIWISHSTAESLSAESRKLLQETKRLELLEPWTNPRTGRTTAISNAKLRELTRELLPVEIEGDPVQFQVNRTKTGWVVELVNHDGVTKFPTKPAVIDPKRIANVTLRVRAPHKSAREWRSKRDLPIDNGQVLLEIGAGQTVFVELR